MIKLQVVGHLGRDCAVKEVNGRTVINFNVAHSERFKDSQGVQKEKTIWVECAYWTDRTAISPYLIKGKLVYVEGSPEADVYTNKEGQPQAALRLRVQNVQLLGGSGGDAGGYNQGQSDNRGNVTHQGGAPAPAVRQQAPEAALPPVDDDLPF